MTLYYDHDADVLYVSFERRPGAYCTYVENEEGNVTRLDEENDLVMGVTIIDFAKRGRMAFDKVGAPPIVRDEKGTTNV